MASRYQLQEEIGRGGMAVVYRAIDTQTGRPVAVKRLALSRAFAAADVPQICQRFAQEAAVAQRLDHPDILRVVDAGRSQDDQDAWMVMELASGHDLGAFVRAPHLLPVVEVVQIAARLARALAYAHRCGVVHRDVKPSNVMWDHASAQLRLMDFGVARLHNSSHTGTGMVLGSPTYMAPEVLTGLPADGRSDIYALSVLLFELLTGALPHHSDNFADLIQQVAHESAPDVRRYCPGLSEGLALVVALGLHKHPKLRYQDADTMAQDLELVLRLGVGRRGNVD
ncbi:serine/threonine-protein kinase [Roseateles sp. BYS180W]|uniref:serine/threonine-protein kinase n=1 Tax=Roseateles rivi TaxID=3299028 RepID=UPI00374904BA